MCKEKEMITNLAKELEERLELFYQQKNAEALGGLDSLIVNMSTAIDCVFKYRDEHEDFQFDEEKLTKVLTEAMQALEENDFIMMADVLQYDFMEYMNELAEAME